MISNATFTHLLRASVARLAQALAVSLLGVPAAAAAPVSQWDTTSQVIFEALNLQRGHNGLAALAGDSRLHTAAESHSADMLSTGNFSHIGSDGSTISSRVRDSGYSSTTVGENIFNLGGSLPRNDVDAGRVAMYGTEFLADLQNFASDNASLPAISTWDDVGRGWSGQNWMAWADAPFGGGWMSSDQHRPSILRGSFTDVGIGYAFTNSAPGQFRYSGYMTQLFAAGDSVAAVPLPAAAWMLLGGLGVLGAMRRKVAG